VAASPEGAGVMGCCCCSSRIVEPVRQRGAIKRSSCSCQVSSRSACATSNRLMDFVPANDTDITSGGKLYDITLQSREQMLCFVRGNGFSRGVGLYGTEPIGCPTGCLRTPPLPLSTAALHPSPQPHVVADPHLGRRIETQQLQDGSTGRLLREQALKYGRGRSASRERASNFHAAVSL
jgi:hypothetical protein